MLPGEIRNAIYWKVLTPKDPYGLFHAIPLFGAQPALSRVNKQIRAESLSIYYAENCFELDIQVRDDYNSRVIGCGIWYTDFCNCIDVFAPPQGPRRRIQGPMRHVRELIVGIRFGDWRTWQASFNISGGRCKRLSGWRLGGDETNWADLLGIVTLVKDRMDAVSISYRMKPNAQQLLVRVLWLLGLVFKSNVWTRVSLSREVFPTNRYLFWDLETESNS